MLLIILTLLTGPGGFASQNKKGLGYYPPYRPYNAYKSYLPLASVPEKFGWNALLANPTLPEAFTRRNILRARLLYDRRQLRLKSVVDIFRLDPESGDGRFLLQFYLFLSGRSYSLPADPTKPPDSRTTMLDFFTSLKHGDIEGMAARLGSLGLTANHQLRLKIYLAKRLLDEGFSAKAYLLYRDALRTLEVNHYGLTLSWSEKHDYYRFLVLNLAAITHQRGEYRKAFGILHWITKTTRGATIDKVTCTMLSILEGACHLSPRPGTKRPTLLTLSAEEEAYRKALLTWSSGWTKGLTCFDDFSRRFPKSRHTRRLSRFTLWLKSNPE